MFRRTLRRTELKAMYCAHPLCTSRTCTLIENQCCKHVVIYVIINVEKVPSVHTVCVVFFALVPRKKAIMMPPCSVKPDTLNEITTIDALILKL
jgi:hypothetical protein